MVQQSQIEDAEKLPVPGPKKPDEKPPADMVSTTRTIMDYAVQYGPLAGGLLAVAIIGGVVIRKWRRRK